METVKIKPVEIDDFAGFATNADSHERPPGVAVEQVNLTCAMPGALTVRGGFRDIVWDNE